jgi:ATP/maltotriose-dependent transcriptional regulator MalT
MTTDDRIDRGRAAFARKAWSDAFELLSAADAESPLGPDDLELAGFAAQYSGHDETAARLAARLHRTSLEAGDFARAARMAFWIAMGFLRRGDSTQGGGWLGRSAGLLEEHGLDTVERGYLAIPDGIRQVETDPAAALAAFERAETYAERFGDRDLAAMARLGRGRSLIGLGETERGVALLDDAMVTVTSGELSPTVTGIVYCASIEAFAEIFDLRRAQDWTLALSEWTARQSDRVSFAGRCLVYRSELKRFHGDWSAAFDDARQAEALLLRPPPEPAVGEAYYEQAELHRLRGEYAAAESAYREASQWGRRPEPGLALLLLARGKGAAARAMIERALAEAPDDIARVRLLPGLGRIALETGDLAVAQRAADDLETAERARPTPLLSATRARLDGEVRLAGGDARSALPALRRAESIWRDLDAPYDAARVRAALGDALRRLGDADSASLEFDAALRTFRELGAQPDIEWVERLAGRPVGRPGGLSEREAEVLRLVAVGDTNRAIASALGISERTVDRHVSNIFTKLGVSSRAAATAFAVEHDLA